MQQNNLDYTKVGVQPPMWLNFMALIVAPFVLAVFVMLILAVISVPFAIAQAILA